MNFIVILKRAKAQLFNLIMELFPFPNFGIKIKCMLHNTLNLLAWEVEYHLTKYFWRTVCDFSSSSASLGLADVVCGFRQLPAQHLVCSPDLPTDDWTARGSGADSVQSIPQQTTKVHQGQALPLPLYRTN